MGQPDASLRSERASRDTRPIAVGSMVESIVGCKWSVRILQACAGGPRRPSALLRECAGLSAKVMNERLRKMRRFGILERSVVGDKPPVEVEYRFTPFGRRFMRILDEVRDLQELVDRESAGGQRPTDMSADRTTPARNPDTPAESFRSEVQVRRKRNRPRVGEADG